MLISNWRKAWKLHSVWLSTLCATASAAWIALPEAQQRAILDVIGIENPAVLTLGGFVAVVIVRLTAQPAQHEEPANASQREPSDVPPS
jgi:hypothetical protein